MQRILHGVLAVGLLLVPQARADDAAAVIDKAIQAAGGAANLTKYKAAHWKGLGKFYGFGDAIDYTGEWHRQLPGQAKQVIDVEFGDMKVRNFRVINGDKAWASSLGQFQELDHEQLAEAMEAVHYDRVVSLAALKDKAYQLTSLGDSTVDKTAAVGVKVSIKGRRDVGLYFDKASMLLLKATIKVKDLMMGGQEFEQEMYYSGYKDVEGAKVAMKIVIKREGKVYIENEITEYKRLERLDDKVFAKPE